MKYTKYIVSSALALALLTGCNGDSDDKEEAGLSGTPVTIETQDDAQNVQSFSRELTEMSFQIADGDLPFYGKSKVMQKAKARMAEEPMQEGPYDCEVSGTYNDVETDTGYTYTANKCNDGEAYYDGIYQYTYTEDETGYSASVSADLVEIYYGDEYNETLTIKFTSTYTGEDTEEGGIETAEIDGSMKVEAGEMAFELGFDNFEATSTFTRGSSEVVVNGTAKVLLPFYDDECGLFGIYKLKTLEPLVILEGPIDSGSIKINDATFVFDGSDMNVTIPGEEPMNGISQIPSPMCSDEEPN